MARSQKLTPEQRKDIAKIAANAGCVINTSVKKTTSIVVIGVQDLSKLCRGLDKSSKQIKAEELISQGNDIKILTEMILFHY